jgi:membrane associated rhomboid family serine protease/Zn-finger nucleic acid-binding protein
VSSVPARKPFFPNLASARMRSTARCPDCREWMVSYTCRTAIVDKCEQCHGIWFDAREIRIFCESLAEYDLTGLRIEKPDVSSEGLVVSQCARCENVLDEFTYGSNTKVRLKRCSRCRGIWSPLAQTVNLVELAKISQLIAPHIAPLSAELKASSENIARWNRIGAAGETLMRPVRGRGWAAGMPASVILPLGDAEAPRWRADVLAIVGLNVLAAFAFGLPTLALAFRPAEIAAGHGLPNLLFHEFGHAHVVHLLGNLFYLWAFGTAVSAKIGTRKFVPAYLAIGVAAALAEVAAHPGSTVPVLGASGAIAGAMGMYLAILPNRSMSMLFGSVVVAIPSTFYLLVWLALQCLYALKPGAVVGVAWVAHLTGFVLGWATGRWLGQDLPYWEGTHRRK